MSDPASRSWGRILLLIGRVVLGGIFIVAAYYKLEAANSHSAMVRRRGENLFGDVRDAGGFVSNAFVESGQLCCPYAAVL